MGRKNSNGRPRHAVELHGDIILACPVDLDYKAPAVNRSGILGATFLIYYVVISAVLTATSMAGLNGFA